MRDEQREKGESTSQKVVLKIDRDDFIRMVESTMVEYNRNSRADQSINKTFLLAGQNPWKEQESIEALEKHIKSLCKSSMYQALQGSPNATIDPVSTLKHLQANLNANQRACNLDEMEG